MRSTSSSTVDRAYARDGRGPMVYGKYRNQGYAVNPLSAKAGGVLFDQGVSAHQAFSEAGLLWEADVVAAGAVYPDGKVCSSPKFKAVVNPTNGAVLGIHGTKFHKVDHTAFIPVLEYHREDLTIENILSLNDGARVYITTSINAEGEVVPGDPVRRNLHLFNSHDGFCSFGGFFTNTRLGCANQLTGIFRSEVGHAMKTGHAFRAKHTQSIQAFAAALPEMLDLERRTFVEQLDEFRAMSKVKLTTELARRILETTFADRLKNEVFDKETGVARPRDLSDLPEIEIIRDIYAGEAGYAMDLPGVRGTVYGLFNAVTQYETHSAGRGAETERARARLESLWNGQSGKRVAVAHAACLAATR